MTNKARRKKTPSNKKQRRAPVIEQLEPRIMLSADLPGMDTLTHEPDDLYKVDVDQVLADADAFFALVSGDAEPTSHSTADAQDAGPSDTSDEVQTATEPDEPGRHELVIVDTSIPDYETLLAGLQPLGGGDAELRIVLLDPQRSGIEQITATLSASTGLDAIHLITHGSEGAIHIGGETLDLSLVQSNPGMFQQWGKTLTVDGDILIYGCDVASTVDGRALIERLAEVTGADIAASVDLTGHEDLGGDWELEYRTGVIDSVFALAETFQGGWEGTLNVVPTLWDYHHDIDLASTTLLSNYPIKIELTEGVNGFSHTNTLANGDDIRFFDSAGNELNYWIEAWNPAGTSLIWVEIANAGTTNIDLYYGNAEVAAASDPDATFLFFDDFADGTTGISPAGWTAVGGATSGTQPSVEDDGGNLVFSDGANSGGPVVSTGSWSDVVVSQEFRTINPGDPINHAGLIARYQDANNMVYGGIVNGNVAQICYKTTASGSFVKIGGDWDISAFNVDDGNWHNQELRLYGDTIELYIDGALVGSADLAASGAPASGSTGFWSQYSNYEAYRDNHIVRSYDGGTGNIATTWVDEGFVLDENSANGTVVGSVLATDPDGDTLSYSITGGNTGNAFAIDGNGQITVNNSSALDFETNPTFTLTILVDDSNGGTDTDTITIALNDINDAPTASNGAVSTSEDTSYVFDAADFNFSDQDGDTLSSIRVTTLESAGSFQLNGVGVTLNQVISKADIDAGLLTFTPATNEFGLAYAAFGYRVNDGSTDSASSYSMTVNVSSVDDPVTIGGDISGIGDEDTDITGTLTATDVADGLTDGTYFTVTTDGTNGTASIDAATGAWTYTPAADFNGSDSFTVTITDDDGHTATQVISITVNPVVDIVDDSLTTDEDTPITANVLTGTNGASADNFEGSPVLTAVTPGSNGTVTFDGAGNVTYTPDANFNGTDTFSYTITSSGVTETATVTVTVNPVDDPVTIGGDTSGSGDEDTVISGTLTATDTADGLTDGTYFTVTTDGANGTATIDPATGAWTYTPAADFNGLDSFTVTITDDDGYTATQLIALTVSPIDDPVTIGGDISGTGDEDGGAIIGTLTATDTVDGLTDGSYFTVSGAASNGTAAIDPASGAWTYTPNANFNGSDSFTVTITDDDGHTATQLISLTVNPVDDPVTIGGDISGTGDEDTVISGTLTATDTADGLTDGTYFTVTTDGANGTATIDPATGAWTYTPAADFNGLDSFTVTITDDDGYTETQVISITIKPVNDAPVLDNTQSPELAAQNEDAGGPSGAVGTLISSLVDFASPAGQVDNVTDVDVAAQLGIAVTDADTSHGTWWYSIDGGSTWLALGAVSENNARLLAADANTRLYFQSETNWNGTLADAITFRAWDQTSGSNGGTADVTVSYTLLDQFSLVSYNNNDGTAQWGTDWIDIDGNAAGGSNKINSGALLIRTNNTTDWIYREANLQDTVNATLSFDYSNNLSVGVGGLVYLQVSSNDGASYTTIATFSDSVHIGSGTFSADISTYASTDTWVRLLTAGDSNPTTTLEVDNFQIAYSIYGGGSSAFSTVTDTANLTVNPIADLNAQDDSFGTDEDTVLNADVSTNDSTTSGGVLTYALDTDATNGSVVMSADGSFTYTPNGNYNGPDSFSYTVTDADSGESDTRTVNLTVNPIADLNAQDDSFGTDEDTVLNADVSTNDSTTSGGVLTYALDTDATNGSVVMSADGSFTYTPNGNYNGPDSFSYTVTDADSGESDTRTVTLTINPVADPPVLGGMDSGSVTEDTDPDLDGLLEVGGVLTISDPDAGESSFQPAIVVGTYGSLVIDAAGSWTYAADNAQLVIQQLDVGESITDVMTVTTADATMYDVTVTITGDEDAPVLMGITSGVVAEDGTPNATGTLSISDVDSSDNPVFFPDEAASRGDNGYGNFTLTAGTWGYALNNAHPDVQALDAGETLTDTHAFVASDGSTQVVTITISGAEDTPLVTGVLIGSVAEDGTMMTGGTLSISDVDRSDNPVSFGNRSELPGDRGLGRFGVSAAGWTYKLDNALASVQALDAGESISDSYTFVASDGSRATATVTISGAEDVPVISGTMRGEVVADQVLTSSGSLSISDIDANDNPVGFPDQAPIPGENGYGTFVLSGSTWVYRLDNVHPAVSGLKPGEVLEDRYAFTASDGSMQTVMVQIRGASVAEELPPPTPPEISVEVDPAPTLPESDEVAEVVDGASPEDPAQIIGASNVSPSPIGDLGASGDTELIRVTLSEDVLASVLATRDGGQKAPPVDKPSPQEARTFLQELKSFWQDGTTGVDEASLHDQRSKAFWSGLDQMLADLDEDVQEVERQQQLNAEVAAGIGVSLTAGFVSWALRAGSIVASFLAAMPTWRTFDPMPVLARDEEDKKHVRDADDVESEKSDSEIEAEAKVDAMFDR